MTLVLPIVITALMIGVFSKRMSAGLWAVMVVAIIGTVTYFYMNH